MYKVVLSFFDLTDGNREYHPGDTFPRAGVTVSAERLDELATGKNRRGVPVIEEVKETAEKPRKRVKRDAD